jgi:acyl-CoA thioesterase FadM
MARIKIELPTNFSFTTTIPVRITDINYGGHVGNDSILSILHEARMQFFATAGYTETKFAGTGLIMADVGIEFKNELFYGDLIIASVAACELSRVSFDIYYKLETEQDDKRKLVAAAKTGMVCYDYSSGKIALIPDEARAGLKWNDPLS